MEAIDELDDSDIERLLIYKSDKEVLKELFMVFPNEDSNCEMIDCRNQVEIEIIEQK